MGTISIKNDINLSDDDNNKVPNCATFDDGEEVAEGDEIVEKVEIAEEELGQFKVTNRS